MQKIKVRCWKQEARCTSGDVVDAFYPTSDVNVRNSLFVHPACGALFALDRDTEQYQKKHFEELKRKLDCPECGNKIHDVLPYPEYLRCPSTGGMEHFTGLPKEIPPDRADFLMEFWDPLTD